MSGVTSDPTYRAAYDAGCAEIDQIVERLAQLRVRKERIEKAVTALKLIVEVGSTVEASRPQAQPVPVAAAPAQPIEALPEERMQQHIDQVLRSLATV
ncbi:MAG: hypothetical protein WBF42_07930 [Terracidiphilus sp.]